MERRFFFFLFGMFLLMVSLPLAAQGTAMTISLAVPEFVKDAFSPQLLAQFEAQHPGVRVNLISSTLAGAAASASSNIDAHLEDLEKYVTSADVLLVDNNNLSLEGTRAGLFMDLSPLANADSTLNSADFLPQAWQSFQWDRGIWALPVSADVVLLLYNPTAFDEAGLTYPNANWTLDDFAHAARALTKTNADGTVDSGFFDYGTSGYLLRSLAGQSLVNADGVSTMPDFSNPELTRILDTWKSLSDDGAVGGFQAGARVMLIGGSANEGPPMTIQRSFGLASFPGNPNATPPAGSLLPGGTAGLEVQGFAVSAGTREPMLAYELAKFLTNSAEVATQLFGSTPARRSLVGMEPESTGERSGPGRGFRLASLNFSPEAQAVIDQGFEHALPARELFFVDYISRAFSLMQDEDLDAQSALQQVEAEAVANLSHAADLRPEIVISVATPAPEVALAPGEIALNFGAASFISPLPNQDRWQQIIDQFVASDPEIGQINLNTDLNLDLDSMAEQNDCFYLPTNAVSSGSLSSVISLDPFMDADPQFDQADLIGGVMQQVRFDNRTWAYPLAIQPEVLRYNPDLFTRAGVPLPDQGWTTTQFVDALHALKSTPDDPAPFIPRDFTGQYLYALITAFGGVPIDNRTNPPTIDFTDPATVDAIRQVLDLAKDGYIDYTELGQGGGVNISLAVGSEEDTDPLYTHTLGAFSFFTRLNREGQTATDRYRYVTYPRGSQHTPISFDLSTAYISTNAANPDACYRWIRELAQHADLFSAMPVQRSLIDDPSTAPELAGLYHQIDTILSDPATIISPSVLRTGGGSIWMQFWLRRAFDRYVLEDADLDAELAEAEQFTRDYAQCAAEIPPTNPTTPEDQLAYFQQFGACAHQVDPTAG